MPRVGYLGGLARSTDLACAVGGMESRARGGDDGHRRVAQGSGGVPRRPALQRPCVEARRERSAFPAEPSRNDKCPSAYERGDSCFGPVCEGRTPPLQSSARAVRSTNPSPSIRRRGSRLAEPWFVHGEGIGVRATACPASTRIPSTRKARMCGPSLGADAGTRTPDPIITSDVLYQLSYVGVRAKV